jgi:hypothetical protein
MLGKRETGKGVFLAGQGKQGRGNAVQGAVTAGQRWSSVCNRGLSAMGKKGREEAELERGRRRGGGRHGSELAHAMDSRGKRWGARPTRLLADHREDNSLL